MRTNDEIMAAEHKRIEFIRNRDGNDAAIEFAKRTLKTYRKAMFDKRSHASLKEYKLEFLLSCVVFKKMVAEAGIEPATSRL